MNVPIWVCAITVASVVSLEVDRQESLRQISLTEKTYLDRCLADSFNITDRKANSSQSSRFLKYPDGTSHPVKIPYPNWTSARILGDIVYILLTEVMGYAAVLVETPSIFDSHMASYVAGCKDPDDENCVDRNFERPSMHFTLETWGRGYKRILNIPLEVRPVLLSVLSYDLVDEWYLWRDIVNAGYNSSAHLSLDYWRSYDASAFAPHLFFDPWTRVFDLIPRDTIVRCADMTADLGIDRATDQYTKVTGDTGVQCANGDRVWFSPACRANNATCIPLILQYNVDMAMQIATLLNMPLAIILVSPGPAGDYADYNRAARAGRMLFGWYQPDDTFVDAAGRLPVLLILPRHDPSAYRSSVFATGNYQACTPLSPSYFLSRPAPPLPAPPRPRMLWGLRRDCRDRPGPHGR